MKKLLLIASLGFMVSCGTEQDPGEIVRTVAAETQENIMADYFTLGEKISGETQAALLANVSSAVKKSGFHGAVDYCNERAIPLTDSFSKKYNVHIQRLSDKNRNAINALANSDDQQAWDQLATMLKDSTITAKHLIRNNGDGSIVYYKAMTIAMPTCISCHGDTKKDIAAETLKAISDKYPNDKATGYKMGDFRGMWKIKFNQEI